MHGWGIAQRIDQLSGEVFRVQQGSLYPALQRLERQGFVTAEWGASESNRRARYYELTTEGRRALRAETGTWRQYAEAVFRILDARQAEG